MRRRNNLFLMLQERRRIAQLNRANLINNRKRAKHNPGLGNNHYDLYNESYGFNFGPGFGDHGYEGFGPEGYYGRDFYNDFGPGFDRYGYDDFGPDWHYGYEYDEFYR